MDIFAVVIFCCSVVSVDVFFLVLNRMADNSEFAKIVNIYYRLALFQNAKNRLIRNLKSTVNSIEKSETSIQRVNVLYHARGIQT
jgi:hypothetical protein